MGGRTGAAQVIDGAGKVFQALFEGLVVLEGQDGGGHQYSYLFIIGDSLEGGSDGYFRFSKTHVAANQAVHWAAAFHVGLDIGRRFDLIRGVFVYKGGFQFLL
ncbi:MAG: hypothetical protein BWY72_02543 [Bacteroidetes bacterium ADurb.Bin416]|nr:MAG: hypothetical protein BWY72_02543 [Bacteroidetes bacterium ADurb.Bin416]